MKSHDPRLNARLGFCWMPVVLGVLLLTSCASGPPEGSELVFAYPPGPLTLDPARCATELDQVLCTLLYSGLVTRFPDGTMAPELGLPPEPPSDKTPEEWNQLDFERQVSSPNGLFYTFRINPKARFANGREIYVQDVRFSFERLLRPSTQAVNDWVIRPMLGAPAFAVAQQNKAHYLLADPVAADSIVGIKEIDRKTFQLELTQPCSSFLELLSMPGARILPATETAEAIKSATDPFALAALGSGPWELESIDPKREIVLRAKPKHWSRAPIRTERLRFKIVENPEQAKRLFAAQTLALLNPPVEERRKWLNNPSYHDQIVAASQTNTAILAFNFQKPFFHDIRHRQAITRSIDIQRLAEVVGRYRVGPARGLLPESLLRPPDSSPPLDLSLEFANARISNDWPVLTLVSPVGSPFEETAEQIRENLQKAGASVNVRKLKAAQYNQALHRGEFDLAFVLVNGNSPVPKDLFAPFLLSEIVPNGLNIGHYANPHLDNLIQQACMIADREKRDDLYFQADRMLRRNCAAVFLWHGIDLRVRQKWLSGYRPGPFPSVAVWDGMFHETNEKRYEKPGRPIQVAHRRLFQSNELTALKAAVLGFIQGLTEFLPISSSGHLKIAERLLGLKGGSQFLFFDCLLHLGTVLAVLIFFRVDLVPLSKALWASPRALVAHFKAKTPFPDMVAFVLYLALGTVVTGCFALLFKGLLEFLFDSLPAVGFALIVTGLLLLMTKPRPQFMEKENKLTFKRAALIGLAQGVAVTPGLSRSGTTIAVGLLMRLPRETAVRFSFLLSIPAIVGATILETLEVTRWVSLVPALVGIATSFLSGLLFLWFLVLIVRSGRFYLFAYYTIPLGILVFFAA